MSSLSLPRPLGSAQSAWWAVASRFLVHGLVTGTWVSRIPAIQTSLHLSNGALGLSLLGAAVGSVAAIPAAGWLVAKYGSRRVAMWTTAGFCVALGAPTLAVDALTLFLALVLYGAMAGANDVAMNAQGVAVERAMEKPTMSRFHAMFSLGGIAGSAYGGLMAMQHITPYQHLWMAAALLLGFVWATSSFLAADVPDRAPARQGDRFSIRHMPSALLLLCSIGFCIFLSEGAMADWTAVYLQQVLGAGPGLAAAGYSVFSIGMTTFRLLGDVITTRLGWRQTVFTGALVAAGGLTWALLMPSAGWALPGFAITGAGFSVIIPSVFAAGGRVKAVSSGAGVAAVSGIGYMGFLVGPPAIGFVSQISSLRVGLMLIVGLSLGAAGLIRLLGTGEQDAVG